MVAFTIAAIAMAGTITLAQVATLAMTFASVAYQQSRSNKLKAEMDKRKQVNVAIEGEPFYLPIVYGRAKVSGGKTTQKLRSIYTHASVNQPSSGNQEFMSNLGSSYTGSKNEFLFVQQAIAYGGINRVIDVLVDDKSWNDPILQYGQRIHVYPNGGLADTMATLNGIPSTNTFTNTAYASMCFKLNREEYNYNGSPNVSFFIEGQKVYDVVLVGSTYQLSATKTYSNNPALVLLDYLTNDTYGKGLDVSLLDLESFYKAKLICSRIVRTSIPIDGRVNGRRPDVENEDGSITTQPALTPRNLPLYECNVVLDSERSIRENIELILESMYESELIWSGGKYRLSLEDPQNETQQTTLVKMNLDESDIVRNSVDLSWPDASSRYAQVTARFRNEFENFADDTVTWPTAFSAAYDTYLAEDSGILLKTEIYLPTTTDPYHALAKAEQMVRMSRRSMVAKFTVGKRGLLLEPGDIVTVTDSTANLASEVMKIQSVKLSADLTAEVEAVQYSYTTFAWNVDDTLAYSNKLDYYYKVVSPSNVVFTTNNPTSLFGVTSGKLTWTFPNDISVSEFLVELSKDNGVTWSTLGTSLAQSFDVTGLNSGVYKFAVRSRAGTGSLSDRTIATNGINSVESFTIQRATSDQIAVIYANTADAATNTQSYTLGSNQFVAYYIYSSDLPTLPVRTGINFTRFVGQDGIPGKSTYTASVFKQGNTYPATPTGGTFNFGTNVLTPPSGWRTFYPTSSYLFMLGTTGDNLRRYTIGNDLDVTGLSSDSVSISFGTINTTTYPTESPLETIPSGFAFNNDGTLLFIGGSAADTIRAYKLTTPWDPSTVVLPAVSSFATTAFETGLASFLFSEDGYKLYISGTTQDRIRQVNLTTPWDLSTAVYSGIQSPTLATQDTLPTDFAVNKEGTVVFVLGQTGNSIYQYTLSTPWDFTTLTYSNISYSFTAQDTAIRSFAVSKDGKTLMVGGITTDTIYQYSLPTAWSLSTVTYTGKLKSVSAQETTMSCIMLLESSKEDIYSSAFTFSIVGDTGTVTAGTWSTPIKVSAAVDTSKSSYVAYIYRRSATSLATPTTGSYNFTTNVLSPPSGWSSSIPAGTDPLYVTTATVSISGATGSAAINSWATPNLLAQNGAPGISTAIVRLYLKNTNGTTIPSGTALPSGTFTYTFATNTLTGGTLNSWTTTLPSVTAGEFVWVIQAVASGNNSTDDILATEFSTPVVLSSSGINGLNSAVVSIYYKNTSNTVEPTETPSGNFVYTFATGALSSGTFNNWSQVLPDLANGEYLWVRQAVASSSGATDTIAATEFSSPACISGVGSNGSPGSPGSRGAGWWRYNAGSADVSALTTAQVSTYFQAATGLAIVEGDRLILATTHATGTKAYIYQSSAWVIQAAFIDGNLLVAGTVTSNALTTEAVTTDKLAANSVNAGKIAAGAVTATKISVTDLSAISANLGTIQVGNANIATGAITSAKIGDLQVDSAKIANLTVGTEKITANAVTAVAIGSLSSFIPPSTGSYTVITLYFTGVAGAPVVCGSYGVYTGSRSSSGNDYPAYCNLWLNGVNLAGGATNPPNSTSPISLLGSGYGVAGTNVLQLVFTSTFSSQSASNMTLFAIQAKK
jgi:hypothetical protein